MRSSPAQEFRTRFQVPDAPALIAETLRHRKVTFTELVSPCSEPFQTGPRVVENAFIVGVQLMDFPRFKFWEEGRQAPLCDLRRGDVTFHDLRRDACAVIDRPFHSIYCHIPFEAIEAVTELRHGRADIRLRYPPGQGIDDPVVRNLLCSVTPAIRGSARGFPVFADHVAISLIAHLMSRYPN